MPTCCISQCKNYSQKGFSLYSLPADPNRRELWIANIGKYDFNSSKKLFICEVHFSDDMWEKPRSDGKRKLKQNAVPTIFNNILICDADTRNIQNEQNQTSSSESTSMIVSNNKYQFDDNRTSSDLSMEISNSSEGSSKECFTEVEKQLSNADVSESSTIYNQNDYENLKLRLQQTELRVQEATQKLQQANVIINKIERSRRILKKHVRRLIDEKKKIARDNLNSTLQINFKKIFNDDQIQVLLGKNTRSFKWSNNTILKALKLRFLCGSNGYNELLNHHLPLPSERTLRRKKEGINFEPGILKDVFDILNKQISLFKDDREKDAVIAIDEMSIVSGEQFDPSTLSYIGNSSTPDSSSISLS